DLGSLCRGQRPPMRMGMAAVLATRARALNVLSKPQSRDLRAVCVGCNMQPFAGHDYCLASRPGLLLRGRELCVTLERRSSEQPRRRNATLATFGLLLTSGSGMVAATRRPAGRRSRELQTSCTVFTRSSRRRSVHNLEVRGAHSYVLSVHGVAAHNASQPTAIYAETRRLLSLAEDLQALLSDV